MNLHFIFVLRRSTSTKTCIWEFMSRVRKGRTHSSYTVLSQRTRCPTYRHLL